MTHQVYLCRITNEKLSTYRQIIQDMISNYKETMFDCELQLVTHSSGTKDTVLDIVSDNVHAIAYIAINVGQLTVYQPTIIKY